MTTAAPTPETDEYMASLEGHAYCDLYGTHHLDADFARRLERERDEARNALRLAESAAALALDERDRLIRENDGLRETLNWPVWRLLRQGFGLRTKPCARRSGRPMPPNSNSSKDNPTPCLATS